MSIEIDRAVITDDMQFVWIPTGHLFGIPSGMVGFWDGIAEDGHNLVTFPEGQVKVSAYATFYEPTEAEIDLAIAERKEAGKGEYCVKEKI